MTVLLQNFLQQGSSMHAEIIPRFSCASLQLDDPSRWLHLHVLSGEAMAMVHMGSLIEKAGGNILKISTEKSHLYDRLVDRRLG